MSENKSFLSTLEFDNAPVDINAYRLKKEAINDAPNAEKQMSFGKHHGKTFEKVPIEYLYWCYQQDFVKKQFSFLWKYCCDCKKANFFDDIEANREDELDCDISFEMPDWWKE